MLTFSSPIELVPRRSGPLHGGLIVRPTTHKLGHYRLEPGPSRTQLRVILGRGELSLVAHGSHISGDSTEVQLDFDAIAAVATVLDEVQRPLTGRSKIARIAMHPHEPAVLVATRWVDVDGNYCVNQRDELLLEFDREVTISDAVKSTGNQVPADLFLLPGSGDERLDDGVEPSTLRQTQDSRVLAITFGSRPYLTVGGTFDPRRDGELEPPSGLAINGTVIRPHRAILDSFGNGVASHRIVDLEPKESCQPFSIVYPYGNDGASPQGHTVTRLPGGSILVAGGGIDGPTAECWLREASGNWLGPIVLKHPRQWHTATYYLGRDGQPETNDDAVILMGGFNGERALGSVEVVLPFARLDAGNPREIPQAYPVQPRPQGMTERFFHTAHLREPLFDQNGETRARIVMVGGQLNSQELNGVIEELTVDVAWPEGAQEPEIGTLELRTLGYLLFPRAYHASALIKQERGERVLLYGGWGKQGFDEPRVQTPVHDLEALLNHAELIDLADGGSQILGNGLPRRHSHALELLEPVDGNPTLLLVGGTVNAPLGAHPGLPMPDTEKPQQALLLTLRDDADGRTTLDAETAGEMIVPRHNFCIAHLPNDDLLIIGGEEDGVATDRVELYEVALQRFSPLCQGLMAPRQGCTAVPTDGNAWLVVGGSGPAPGEAVEIFYWQGL